MSGARRICLALSGVCLVAACSTMVPVAPQATISSGPLPTQTVEEVFARTIRDICYSAVEADMPPHAMAEAGPYSLNVAADPAYRTEPGDSLFSADYASAPVLVSVAPGKSRCDVIAVRGDYADLKAAAEAEIARFDAAEAARGRTDRDLLAAIDRSPQKGYAAKFTLLYGEAVYEQDTDQ